MNVPLVHSGPQRSLLKPRQIEAIDSERTKLHNEGAELMAQRLAGTVEIDQGTARRLFALISALRWRV